MSIASSLQNIANSLSGVLTRINNKLISKGSSAASTLNQVEEKIDAIPSLDTSDATAYARDIRQGYTAYARGSKITGTLTSVNKGVPSISVSSAGKVNSSYYQSEGLVTAGTVVASEHTLSSLDDPNFIASNIKNGTTIFGVQGNYSGGPVGGDATASDMRLGKSAYVNGYLVVGNLSSVNVPVPVVTAFNNGRVVAEVSQSAGITDGGFQSTIHVLDSNDDPNFLSSNIKYGVTIFGLTGTYSGGGSVGGDAVSSDIRYGKTAYVNGVLITGDLAEVPVSAPVINVLAGGIVYSNVNQLAGITLGGLQSSAHVLSSSDDANFIPSNIKNGVSIFGVTGTYSGGGGGGFSGCELGSPFSSSSVTHDYDSSLDRDYLHISLSEVDSSRSLFGIYVIHSATASSVTPYVNSFIALSVSSYWSITYSTEGNALPSTDADFVSNVLHISFRGSGQVLDGSNYFVYPIYGTSY